MPGHLHRARSVVLEWVRAGHRDPTFLAAEAEAGLERKHEEIAQRFLAWAKPAGFAYQTVRIGADGPGGYEVQWTHRGASFVGFKQPAPESTAEDALLAGCAALLENEWCRKQLPK
ncbi:MAG: hypothetical protein ABJF10_23975 [Chthoniobacter sp.]|uniref:hypothetical protein n=1 Tax=Chthoniobacter sp. TaxID=2510640 RepID=UPI0032A25018